MKAKWSQKKDTIRKECNKLKAMRKTIKKKEEELDTMEEERSSSFSSGSPLLPSSGSESEKEDDSPADKVEATGSGVPPATGKPPPKAMVPPPPKSGTPQPPPAPVLKSAAAVPPKVSDTACTGSKPAGKGVREKRPLIPPGEPAPDHNGKPDAHGELYPGFRKTDPRYCEACEQLRRGWKSATKAHRPKAGLCAWAPRNKP